MKPNIHKIEIRKRHYVPEEIVNAIMTSQNYTREKAKQWLKHFIFDSIKEEIEFYDGVPYRNKEVDYEYVKKQLDSCGVQNTMINKFFNKNFSYAEAEVSKDAEWMPATTIAQKSRHLKRGLKEFG